MDHHDECSQKTESSSSNFKGTQSGEEPKYWVTTRLGLKAVTSPEDIKSLLDNSIEVREDNVEVDINIKTMFETRLIERMAEVELEARRNAGYSDSLESSSASSDDEWTWQSETKKYVRKKQLRSQTENSYSNIKITVPCEGMFHERQRPILKVQREPPWNQSLSTSDNAMNKSAKLYRGDADFQPKPTLTRRGPSSLSLPTKIIKSAKKRCKNKKIKYHKERPEKLGPKDLITKKSDDSSTLYADSDISA